MKEPKDYICDICKKTKPIKKFTSARYICKSCLKICVRREPLMSLYNQLNSPTLYGLNNL